MSAHGFVASAAGFVLVAACAGSGEFAIETRLEARRGVIEFFEDTVGITLPDTVFANQSISKIAFRSGLSNKSRTVATRSDVSL